MVNTVRKCPYLVTFMLLLGSAFFVSAALAADYYEAPQLRALVEAGQLPPVAERLPSNPRVLEAVEQIGTYGGTWRNALIGGGDGIWIQRTIGYDQLMVYTQNYDDIIPNVAESLEVSEDATEYTFRLREGMKWSDGTPFTSSDIMFWYQDVILNEELTPVIPSWLMAGGEPPAVEAPDEYTIVFTFAGPHAFFLDRLAQLGGWVVTGHPRHYLEQYHSSYNADNIDALVQQASADNWAGLFAQVTNRWLNTDLPSLLPWVLTRPYDGSTARVTFERNPYYWKVDTDGNQLPYLDSVTFDMISDAEVLLLRVMAGEIDMISRHINNLDNLAVLHDNMERGDYRFFTAQQTGMNVMSLNLNLTQNDPVKREIFQNRDFRAGLSHAINRQEIIDLIYVGQGEPWQMAGQPSGPYHNEQLAKQYTEYDVSLANEYLDRAGYTERDAAGYRLGPDGNRISFTIETFERQPWVDTLELIQGYWREVGIDAQVRVMERSFYNTRTAANEHDAAAWFSAGGVRNMILEPYFKLPHMVGQSMYAIEWARWYQTRGAEGEEPPEVVKEQMALYDQILTTGDAARQQDLMMQIIDIAADEFYTMGIARSVDDYGIVRNNFRNVPKIMAGIPSTWPGQTNPEQYFIEDSGR